MDKASLLQLIAAGPSAIGNHIEALEHEKAEAYDQIRALHRFLAAQGLTAAWEQWRG